MASPAPRKTHRYGTPRPSVTPPRQRRMVGARAAGTPSRLTEDTAAAADIMDVDDAHMYNERVPVSGRETLYARTDEISVAFHAALPFEVRRELKGADFYSHSWTGAIDALTGYALAASSSTCFVWHHTKPTTCYILPCPPSSRDFAEPAAPLHAVVPSRSRSEPGLVLLSLRGDIRFWDSIASGLAGGGSFESITLELGEGEYASGLLRVDGQIYIASTSHGRLFRLTLTSQSGRHTLSARLFAPPPTPGLSFARLLWSTPAPQPTLGNISALALGSVGGSDVGRGGAAEKDLWTLSETRVQRWSLNKEVLLGEVDVREAMGNVEDLEGVDLGVESNGTLVVLVSYAGSEQETAAMALDQYGGFGMSNPVPRRIYALVRLNTGVPKYEGGVGNGGVIEGVGDGMKIESVTGVPYATTAASAPAHPRLALLGGGAVVVIRFVDVVVFCSRDSPYQDRLTLKAPQADQILGLGVLPLSQPAVHYFADEREHMEELGSEEVLILAAGVLMRARVDLGNIKAFNEATGRIILIKAILTQAILYGSNPDNPLCFSFPPEVDEEALMAGAEGLSSAVLESDPAIIRPNHDLTSQLTSRKERLSWLIRFINDNAVLGKISQRSRQRLATDAEKLYACHQLWLKMNEHLDAGATHSLVTDAIHTFTASHPLPHPSASHDVVRDFFRYRAAEIGRLIPFMVERVENAGEGAMKEVGGAVVTILQAALSYRAYNLAVYGVDLPMIKPWTSRPSVIDGVLKLVDTATRFALDPSTTNTKSASKELLPGLATMFFACVQERLDWLGGPIAADEPGSERDHIELKERFDQLRPEILETLRLTSHLPHALTLSVSHADFRSLAALLHQDTVYPPTSNPHARTIAEYVDRFGGAFAKEVVRWCMVHGEARVVFTMEESGSGEWGKYMDEYWTEEEEQGRKCDAVVWLRDLGQARWSVAGTRLLREAKGAGDVSVKHFMLSVGKLAHLAQVQEGGEVDEASLDAFHDSLDFISVQEKLLEDFCETFSSLRGKQKQSLDGQVDAVIRAKATRLKEEGRKGLLGMLKIFVRQVIQGKVLSVEDVVDILTLQDEEGVENYATALHLLAHAEDIPDTRRISSFRRVWCRIYNKDDWDSIRETANITDAQLTSRFRATALYMTLRIILPSPQISQLPGVDLDPNECLPVPLIPEIKSRFPGIQEDMVGDLARDYRAESSGVEGLRLGDVYHRVRELVMLDLGYERQG